MITDKAHREVETLEQLVLLLVQTGDFTMTVKANAVREALAQARQDGYERHRKEMEHGPRTGD